MKYEIIHQPSFSTLVVKMNAGESFKAEAGAMVSMSSNVTLEAKSSGKGFFGSIKAAVGGESFFASIFTCQQGEGEVLLAPSAIGDIMQTKLSGGTLYASGGSYLAGDKDLEISTKGSFKALLAGEGLFLQKITGSGDLFLSSYGSIIEKQVSPGSNYIIDTEHILAFEETLEYTVKKSAKGIFSTLASGEGLVAEFSGNGKVWLHTRNLSAFASFIGKYIVKS